MAQVITCKHCGDDVELRGPATVRVGGETPSEHQDRTGHDPREPTPEERAELAAQFER
jgi:hypothetical protein